jgi:pilus assembly protein Flp/PilA
MIHRTREAGSTAVEYGLLAGLIAAVIVAAVAVLGVQVQALFCAAVGALHAQGLIGVCS